MRAKILNASAGSGKTYQLAYQYVRDVVEQPSLYRHILAVTFTNKATEEMKTRILKEIHTLASGAESSYLDDLCRELRLDERTVRRRACEVRSKMLHDYSHFTVLTIDTFFQRILRAFIKELGIDLDYNVEIETASVLAKGADTLIDEIRIDGELLRWLTAFVQERIDEGRKWDIRDGILSLAGELFKEKNKESLAAACSKEELGRIVARATAAAEAARKELRDMAQQAVGLIAAAGLCAADFPYKDKGFVACFYTAAAGACEDFSLRKRVVEALADAEKWGKAGTPSRDMEPALRPLLQRMCTLYAQHARGWNTCDLLRENYRSFALLADLYARVEQLCDEQNMLLLSETKYILSAFIGHNDAPFIYEKVGNRFERFMIDEFQDTSVKEWENFLPLLQNAMAQSERCSVLLVGDIKQSIYRWRGGDWKILHRTAREQLGEENTTVVNLEENFRSLPVVVAFNNCVISRAVETDNALLDRTLAEAAARGDVSEAEHEALRGTLADAYRTHRQTPRRKATQPGYVSVETFDERPPVVERICELLDKGFAPSDIMILVRSATDGARVAAELLDFKRRNTDPRYRFDVMTQEALVVGKAPVCTFVAAALRLALDPDDRLHRAVYNRFLYGGQFARPLTDQERDFFRSIRLLSPEEAFERIVMRYDLQHDRRQTAYLQAIHQQIIAFTAGRIADIALFLKWWDEEGSGRSLSVERSLRSVEITTIHKAKGLERRAIVIPYCSWQLDPRSGGNVTNIVWAQARGGEAGRIGRFPVKYKKAMADSEFSAEYYRELVYTHVDNINLLYVALTRAAESLHVFVPRQAGKSVGALLLQSLPSEEENAGFDLRHTSSEQGERFELGTFAGPVDDGRHAAQARQITLEEYPTAQADLRLRLPSQRYFEGGQEVELSPRNFGILMHRAFEQADDEEQIRRAVARMRAEAVLSEAEAAQLNRRIDLALADPVAKEWFSGRWRQVRNEHEIIVPGSGATRRPDRVMTDGRRAVVVDYKFGDREAERYRGQIRDYLDLMQRMGYTQTEGYLWYVRLGRIEKVENP